MLIDLVLLYKRRLSFSTAMFGFEVLRPETAGAGTNNYYWVSINYSVFTRIPVIMVIHVIYVVYDLLVYYYTR